MQNVNTGLVANSLGEIDSYNTHYSAAVLGVDLDGKSIGQSSVHDDETTDGLSRKLTEEQEQLLLEHLPLVQTVARQIHARLPKHVDIDDLISAGFVGLMDAATKFDVSKKVKFRSYACFRIRGAMLDSLRDLDWASRGLRRKGRMIQEAISTLTKNLGRSPSDDEVAKELQIDLTAYQMLLSEVKNLEIGSLNAEYCEDSDEEMLAYIPNPPEDSPLFRCLNGELQERLAKAIEELPERERLVTTLYYYEEANMKEIALILNVGESRVSQIHASAVLRLRGMLESFVPSGTASKAPARSYNRSKLAGKNKGIR